MLRNTLILLLLGAVGAAIVVWRLRNENDQVAQEKPPAVLPSDKNSAVSQPDALSSARELLRQADVLYREAVRPNSTPSGKAQQILKAAQHHLAKAWSILNTLPPTAEVNNVKGRASVLRSDIAHATFFDTQ